MWILLLVVCLTMENVLCGEDYVIFSKPVNWYQALINCKKEGMELVSIHNQEEDNAFEAFLEVYGQNKGYWLAGTKEGNQQYYWATTGIRVTYSKWAITQPDNFTSDHNFGDGEHCIQWGMGTKSADPVGWNDLTCADLLPYVCQTFDYCDNGI